MDDLTNIPPWPNARDVSYGNDDMGSMLTRDKSGRRFFRV